MEPRRKGMANPRPQPQGPYRLAPGTHPQPGTAPPPPPVTPGRRPLAGPAALPSLPGLRAAPQPRGTGRDGTSWAGLGCRSPGAARPPALELAVCVSPTDSPGGSGGDPALFGRKPRASTAPQDSQLRSALLPLHTAPAAPGLPQPAVPAGCSAPAPLCGLGPVRPPTRPPPARGGGESSARAAAARRRGGGRKGRRRSVRATPVLRAVQSGPEPSSARGGREEGGSGPGSAQPGARSRGAGGGGITAPGAL